ncbi:polyamine ABC transporter substrate-binding protein [Candidatus Bipolaricaulota bacterium]|nr:polyamine ABC transporter substrate-binding protein [Candidatus Bipolaricaulota bacterium]
MTNAKLNLGKVLLVGVISLILIAPAVVAQEELAEEQILDVGVAASDLNTLDPHLAVGTQDRGAVDMVFNGLVRFEPGDMDPEKIEPDLAKSWEVSSDGLEWTFHLREGVKFHPFPGQPNGYEMTSEDVVYSIKRAANPEHSAYSGGYDNLENVEALDRYTVKLTLEKQVPSLLGLVSDYSGGFIVSKKAVEEMGDDFTTHPVGTGPFAFDNYVPGQKSVFVRNEDYFRDEPILEKVVWRYMPDISSRLSGLRTGELDLIEGLRKQAWIEKAQSYKGVEPVVFGPGETVTLHFNLTREPLDKLKVRQAIAYALDRPTINSFYGDAITTPLYSPIPSNYLGGLTKEEVAREGLLYERDLDKAKELLEEAGYPDGFELDVVITERESYQKTLVVAQDMLSEIGIKVNIKQIDHSAYHSQIRDDVNPMVIYVCARFPTANSLLTQFYHSASIVTKPTAITNFSHYGDVDLDDNGTIDNIDKLIEIARTSEDPEFQKQLWGETQEEILSDAVAYPITTLGFSFAKKPGLDWGYELDSTLALTPQIKWNTRILAS